MEVVKVESTIQSLAGHTGQRCFRGRWPYPCRGRIPNSPRRYEFSGGTRATNAEHILGWGKG